MQNNYIEYYGDLRVEADVNVLMARVNANDKSVVLHFEECILTPTMGPHLGRLLAQCERLKTVSIRLPARRWNPVDRANAVNASRSPDLHPDDQLELQVFIQEHDASNIGRLNFYGYDALLYELGASRSLEFASVSGEGNTCEQGIITLLERCRTLSRMKLGGEMSFGEDAIPHFCEAVRRAPSLTDVGITDAFKTERDTATFLNAVADNPKIIELDCRNCTVGNDAGPLIRCLTAPRRLKKLNVEGCRFSDEAFERVANAIATNASLTTLDASQTVIGAKGTRALARAILKSRTLTIVDVSGDVSELDKASRTMLAEAVVRRNWAVAAVATTSAPTRQARVKLYGVDPAEFEMARERVLVKAARDALAGFRARGHRPRPESDELVNEMNKHLRR